MNNKIIQIFSIILGWILMVGLLGFLASRWSLFCAYIYFGKKPHCFYWGNMLKNCCIVSLEAIKEEPIYRSLPFFVATLIVIPLKSKNAKIIVITICVILIVMIQLQFGYKHFDPVYRGTPIWLHIKLQGVVGILLAITYGLTFYVAMKKLYKKSKYPILTFVICHIIATITSISVHAINNILIVIAESF